MNTARFHTQLYLHCSIHIHKLHSWLTAMLHICHMHFIIYRKGGPSSMAVEPQQNATFYQYKLIKKWNITRLWFWTYLLLPVIALAAEMYFFSWESIGFWVLSFPLVLWIQFVISRSVLIMTVNHLRKKWRFQFQYPWIGYLPDQHMSYSTFRRVLLHTTWIGLCFTAVLFMWLPVSFSVSLVVWHVWLCLPRLLILLRLFRQRKDGMVKLNKDDVSYYIS